MTWGDREVPLDYGGVRGRSPEEARANAAHIVRCVNEREALVLLALEAETTLDYLDGIRKTWGDEGVLRRRADQLRAALAAAQSPATPDHDARPSELDQERISRLLGSTMRPISRPEFGPSGIDSLIKDLEKGPQWEGEQ